MKNKMLKNLCKVAVIITGCLMLASFSPSLDGRAVVVDEGVFPSGIFAKTVGYLPGDIISVTNIAGDSTVDILVIGALDPSEGVAIMLSPEAAKAIGIDSTANNIVKITKRSNQDERVYGTAIIAKQDSNYVSSPVENEDEETVDEKTVTVEEEIQNEDTQNEGTLGQEAEKLQSTDEIAEETAAESEKTEILTPDEENEEEYWVPDEEENEEEYWVPDEKENEIVEETGNETVEEITEENPAETVQEENVVYEEYEEEYQPVEDEIPAEEYSEEEFIEEEDPFEEFVEEEVPEDFTEEKSEGVIYEEDDLNTEEPEDVPAFEEECEEINPEEFVEEEVSEEVVEENLPEETTEEISEEPFEEDVVEEIVEEEVPEQEKETEEVTEPADEVAEDFEEDELPVEETEAVSEETPVEDAEEYEAIVLVPAQNNSSFVNENEEITDSYTEAFEEQLIEEMTDVTETVKEEVIKQPSKITSYSAYVVETMEKLEKGKYYIQIGALKDEANLLEVINKYGKKYPVVVVPADKGSSKVLIGPLSIDEYGTVLERFKAYGYKDAFVRKIK